MQGGGAGEREGDWWAAHFGLSCEMLTKLVTNTKVNGAAKEVFAWQRTR